MAESWQVVKIRVKTAKKLKEIYGGQISYDKAIRLAINLPDEPKRASISCQSSKLKDRKNNAWNVHKIPPGESRFYANPEGYVPGEYHPVWHQVWRWRRRGMKLHCIVLHNGIKVMHWAG